MKEISFRMIDMEKVILIFFCESLCNNNFPCNIFFISLLILSFCLYTYLFTHKILILHFIASHAILQYQNHLLFLGENLREDFIDVKKLSILCFMQVLCELHKGRSNYSLAIASENIFYLLVSGRVLGMLNLDFVGIEPQFYQI